MEDVLESFATKQHEKFEKMLDDKLEKMMDAKIQSALDPINKRLDTLEKMAGSASSRAHSAPPSEFVPAYLDIKGFVEIFEDRLKDGVTRLEASELLENLKKCVPGELQKNIGDFEVKDPKIFSVEVFIHDRIHEIRGHWRHYLTDPSHHFKGRELFTTLEKSPESKNYAILGRLKRFLEGEAAGKLEGHTVRIFWGNDLCGFLEAPDGSPTLIAEAAKGELKWDLDGLKLLGLPSAKVANHKLLVASGRRR